MLANDSDAEGEALTVTAATLADPALGTVIISPDGTLGFVPAANFTGTVTINAIGERRFRRELGVDGHGERRHQQCPERRRRDAQPGRDGSYTLQPADLGFSDADAGQTLAGVRIDSCPQRARCCSTARRWWPGTVVTAGPAGLRCAAVPPAADGNSSNYAHFTFSVQGQRWRVRHHAEHLPLRRHAGERCAGRFGSAITVAEESVNTPLGLVAPTDIDGDALTITVTGSALRRHGHARRWHAGHQWPGAHRGPVGRAAIRRAGRSCGGHEHQRFSYSVNDGSVTVNAGTTISVTPVNDAPVASSSTITVARVGQHAAGPHCAHRRRRQCADDHGDGPARRGTVTLADGTPVTNGQVLTAAQLAGLQFDAPADQLAATTTPFTYRCRTARSP